MDSNGASFILSNTKGMNNCVAQDTQFLLCQNEAITVQVLVTASIPHQAKAVHYQRKTKLQVQKIKMTYSAALLNCANYTHLLDVWVICIIFMNIHLITTLTYIFTFAKVIYKS